MVEHDNMNDTIKSRCKTIKEEISVLKIKKEKKSDVYFMIILVSLNILIIGTFVIKNIFYDPMKASVEAIGLAFMLYIFIGLTNNNEIKKRQMDLQIMSLQEELDILENEEFNYEIIADKKFKLHQDSLKRYYDINISQLKNMYYLGCISVSIGVFLICLILVLSFMGEIDTVTIIGGTISSIIINFVGALAIKMFSDTNKYSIEFHNKMAKTNSLLLSETLIARITDKELQEKTLADVAKAIVENDK